jgi:hypothetical protein
MESLNLTGFRLSIHNFLFSCFGLRLNFKRGREGHENVYGHEDILSPKISQCKLGLADDWSDVYEEAVIRQKNS